MTRDTWFSLLLGVGGAILSIHCSRAGWRELRSGVGEDLWGPHARARNPVRFWFTIAMNFAAAALGALFLLFGVVMLAVEWL